MMLSAIALACLLASATGARWTPPRLAAQPADVSQFPWHVAIETPAHLLCSGSIIGATWVLSAARCIDGYGAEYLSVRAGTSSIRGSDGVVYDVAEAQIHQGFSWANGDYDIAVLNIGGTFAFGPNIQAVSLADSELTAGEEVNITAWGYTNLTEPAADQLLAVSAVTVELSACNAAWGDISDNMLCTQSGGGDACAQDGGGAVVVDSTQYGVLSRTQCGNDTVPDVHISVVALRSWISGLTGV